MANTYLTSDIITKEAQAILHEKCTFLKNINTQYDDSFANKVAQIGDTIRIREPHDPQVVDGAVMPAVGSYDLTDRKRDLKITSRKHVPLIFTMSDLASKIEVFSERFIEPAISNLATAVEADVLHSLTPLIPYTVGTPGVVPNSIDTALAARAMLNQNLAPKRDRKLLLSSAASAAIISGSKGLFNDQSQIAKQYTEGMMGTASGFDWMESESIYSHTRGSATNGTVTSTVATNGATSISLSGLGASTTVKKGDIFTIANVRKLHYQTKKPTAALQQFVVTADVTASAGGVAVVNVAPDITFTVGSEYRNVETAPQAAAVVTWVGAPSSILEQSLAFMKDAFTFATVDLPLPNGTDMASRNVYEGISLRLIRDYEISNDRLLCRLDIMYGYAVKREALACRITS